jgi:hypothetical protein
MVDLTHDDLFDEPMPSSPPRKRQTSPNPPLPHQSSRASSSAPSSSNFAITKDTDVVETPPFIPSPQQAAFSRDLFVEVNRMREYNKAVTEYNARIHQGGGANSTRYTQVKSMIHRIQPPVKQRAKAYFLTGVPGSGKTATIIAVRRSLAEMVDPNVDAIFPICASTATAATVYNGGKTAHSFLGLGDGTRLPTSKNDWGVQRAADAEVFFMDELSMVDGRFFAAMDLVFRMAKGNDDPFGNVILVGVGDFLQLPPVILENHPDRIAAGGKIIDVPVLFETDCWIKAAVKPYYLDYSFRQQQKQSGLNGVNEADVFLKLLAKVRMAQMDDDSLALLSSRVMSLQSFKQQYIKDNGEEAVANVEPTMLHTKRNGVEKINSAKLASLPGPLTVFAARYLSSTHGWKELNASINSPLVNACFSGVVLDDFAHPGGQKWTPVYASLKSADPGGVCSYRRRAVYNCTGVDDPEEDHGGRRRRREQDHGSDPKTLGALNKIATDCARSDIRTPFYLQLKKDAQVTCSVNHNEGFPVNGSKGVVVDFMTQNEFTYQWRDNRRIIEDDEVRDAMNGLADPCDDADCPFSNQPGSKQSTGPCNEDYCWWHYMTATKWPVVKFLGGQTRLMKPILVQVGSVTRRGKNGTRVTETLYQFCVPLRLGWADTIHAAQGQTCLYGYFFVERDMPMDFGQFYVAVSRFPKLTSFAMDWFDVASWQRIIRAHPRIVKWYEEMAKQSLLDGLTSGM